MVGEFAVNNNRPVARLKARDRGPGELQPGATRLAAGACWRNRAGSPDSSAPPAGTLDGVAGKLPEAGQMRPSRKLLVEGQPQDAGAEKRGHRLTGYGPDHLGLRLPLLV